jgi:hypothetical protein
MDGSEREGDGFLLLSSFRAGIPESGTEGERAGGRIKRPKIVNDHGVQ